MLELMLAGNNVTVIPESGPGNKKLLAGNRTDGWFGLVSPEEMPFTSAIATATGLAVTMPQATTVPLMWLKAVLAGKYVFYPSTPINNLSLTAIYNAGAVFGTDDNGINVPTGSTATNQLKLLTFTDKQNKTWCFKIRLINAASPNDLTAVTTPVGTKVEAGEMFKLYSHVMSGAPASVDGVKWDKLVGNSDVYLNRYHSTSVYSNQVFNGAPNLTVGQYGFTAISTLYPWMPLLELMNPDTEVIPVFDVAGETPALISTNPAATTSVTPLTPAGLDMISNDERPSYDRKPTIPTALLVQNLDVGNSNELPPYMTK